MGFAGIHHQLRAAQPAAGAARRCDAIQPLFEGRLLCSPATEVSFVPSDHATLRLDRPAVPGEQPVHACVYIRTADRAGTARLTGGDLAGERAALCRSETGEQ